MSRTSNFNKKDIIAAALEIVRNEGEEALTARSLSKAIGCSTSPLFTVYGNLEEIRKDVREAAQAEFNEYVKDALNYVPAFKEFGLRQFRFAKNNPNLFKMLFLSKEALSKTLNEVAMECLHEMRDEYHFTDEQMTLLFDQVWSFACGLAMLTISGAEEHSEEQASEMLSRQFVSTLMFIKSGAKSVNITPRLREEGESSAFPLPE